MGLCYGAVSGLQSWFWIIMEEEKDAFYVVRKGDIVGLYKSFSECQAQAGFSVCDPSVSVYKGYCLPKDAEEFLASHGLKNASYVINAADVKGDIFGKLQACPFQQPGSSKGTSNQDLPQKRLHKAIEYINFHSWILQFDGASKGNPGQAGAGAVLRAVDGSAVIHLREGVGIATNNVAEYRALILGMKYALKKGIKRICARGDSQLVCMQFQGLWKTKNQNMANLCEEAKELGKKFSSFQIEHVLREFNSEADAQANLAVNLMDGQVQEEYKK
ncbi:hypothetical protein PVL29_019178 [Vitis rotundifolia]|uniref:RNase H type-1 domain-containing protein n=1 Tax=Vitis rotundifolia TaxID=103349 RepID=A0AA38Z7U1_VITRO|nr:hypothetical protein PVL29_019178 [Vitis rotundifolia]